MSMISRLRPLVAVPARNEERRLPALLAALAEQTWQQTAGEPLSVVIVLNNCEDLSRIAIGSAIADEPRLAVEVIDLHFAPDDAHVGTARRLAMEAALALGGAPEQTAILATDADAVPAPDWVEVNLRHLREVDIVGGKILGDLEEEAQLGPGFRRRADLHARYSDLIDRLAAAIDPVPHDPWPRHHDHTGASIAVRAAVYAAVGGMPPLPYREDLAFVSRVTSAGFRLRHPTDVRVTVSARLAGRAAGGMADCLKEWMRAEACGAPLLVEDPLAVLARLTRRRRLRQLELASVADRVALAYEIGVHPSSLWDDDGAPLSSARLIEMLAPDEPDAPASVPIDMAISAVDLMLAQIQENVRAA